MIKSQIIDNDLLMNWVSKISHLCFKIYYYNGSSYTLNTTLNTNGSVTFASTLYAGTGTSSIDVLQIRNEIQASNGSASDPSYTFSSDGDTGMYRQTTNSIGFATGGVQHYWNANGIYLANGDLCGRLSIRWVFLSIVMTGFARLSPLTSILSLILAVTLTLTLTLRLTQRLSQRMSTCIRTYWGQVRVRLFGLARLKR